MLQVNLIVDCLIAYAVIIHLICCFVAVSTGGVNTCQIDKVDILPVQRFMKNLSRAVFMVMEMSCNSS